MSRQGIVTPLGNCGDNAVSGWTFPVCGTEGLYCCFSFSLLWAYICDINNPWGQICDSYQPDKITQGFALTHSHANARKQAHTNIYTLHNVGVELMRGTYTHAKPMKHEFSTLCSWKLNVHFSLGFVSILQHKSSSVLKIRIATMTENIPELSCFIHKQFGAAESTINSPADFLFFVVVVVTPSFSTLEK